MKLDGIERGINDRAKDRAIVMHGAEYVSDSWIANQGYIGRSEGCPAVPMSEAPDIIDALKNGACLFVYTPSKRYISHSNLLR